MVTQIRRAALSVHLHIAEGSSRKSEEQKRYYEIARGSVIEIDAAVDVADDLSYLIDLQFKELGDSMIRCFQMLQNLSNTMQLRLTIDD